MPSLSDYAKDQYLKMILIGHSGTGKTGALACLAMAGYKLRILDFDKGLDSLVEALKFHDRLDALENVEYETLDDPMQSIGGKILPKGTPVAFQQALALMTNWGPASKKGAKDLGKPSEWGDDTFLVIDSVTHMSQAAMRLIQTLNSNGGGKITQPEWGDAQRLVEQVLTLTYSAEFKCNLIANCHIAYIQEGDKQDDKGKNDGELKGLPMSLGKALSPKIPTYFNHMLLMDVSGIGAFKKRTLQTQPNGIVSTKSPILSGLPKELPIETGLLTYANRVLGKDKQLKQAITSTTNS